MIFAKEEQSNIMDTMAFARQSFDYLLVLDFEATCWPNYYPLKICPEIIEFPCVLYDVRQNKIVEEFQRFVKPTEEPILSDFCVALTGIQQTQVNDAAILFHCLYEFMNWLSKLIVKYHFSITYFTPGYKCCAFATWSDSDIGMYLRDECRRKYIRLPLIFFTWINVQCLYYKIYGKCVGLHKALRSEGLSFEGRPHSGLHDARNTVRLISKLLQGGLILKMTTTLVCSVWSKKMT